MTCDHRIKDKELKAFLVIHRHIKVILKIMDKIILARYTKLAKGDKDHDEHLDGFGSRIKRFFIPARRHE